MPARLRFRSHGLEHASLVSGVGKEVLPGHERPILCKPPTADEKCIRAGAAAQPGGFEIEENEWRSCRVALATAIGVREQNLPAPVHVVAVYPIAQASNLSTPSYQDSEKAKPLNKAMMEWYIGTTIAKPDDRKDPRIDLVDADLKGLAAVTLINARIDPLRSDADLLAAALRRPASRPSTRSTTASPTSSSAWPRSSRRPGRPRRSPGSS